MEAELEELKGLELEEQLLQPVVPVAKQNVKDGKQPARPVPRQTTVEEDELAELTTELAL